MLNLLTQHSLFLIFTDQLPGAQHRDQRNGDYIDICIYIAVLRKLTFRPERQSMYMKKILRMFLNGRWSTFCY